MGQSGAVDDAKRELRTRMRAVRASIAADTVVLGARSARISASVIAAISAAERPGHVLLYVPLPGEPDLAAVAAWCAANGVTTHVPSVAGDALLVEPDDSDPMTLDVVVVPGLAYTPAGARLGQGGGHFDRFLTRLRDDCLRIGVAFTEQLVDELPTDVHDVAVDVVITG
jgi:5-formyltetrahydrofolate cyclo-ligase